MNETLFDAYGNRTHIIPSICVLDCFNAGSVQNRCLKYPDNVNGSKCKNCILEWFDEERSHYG